MNRGGWIVTGAFAVFLGAALYGTSAIIGGSNSRAPGGTSSVGGASRLDPYQAGLAALRRGDHAAAVAEWTRIAETDARAQAGLGDIYRHGGGGVDADLRQALAWYYRAAAVMNTDAELALAKLFAEGAMGQPDFATAGFWFRNAGMHGAAEGAYAAGTYLEAGRGTRADPVDAAAWFSLAAELGHQAAPGSRDLLLRGFSAAQRTMYDQRVREFQEQRRTGDTTFHGVGPT